MLSREGTTISCKTAHFLALVLFVSLLAVDQGPATIGRESACPPYWNVNPIKDKPYYLHIPKTGTSFQTTLLRAYCPETNYRYARQVPKFSACHFRFAKFKAGHPPLAHPKRHAGHQSTLVFMTRRPVERIVSGYFHNYHDCAAKGNNTVNTAFNGTDILEYAECVNGCAVNMLTGKKCGSGRPQLTRVSLANRERCPRNTRQNSKYIFTSLACSVILSKVLLYEGTKVDTKVRR